MALTAQVLLADLDQTLDQASDSWRGVALRRIADLFCSSASLYSDEQVTIFDEVMCRLLPKKTDRALLADLAGRLAPLEKPPRKLIERLARHNDVAICGPVLEQAKGLPDDLLIEAADKDRVDPAVLAKIAARAELSAPVTDALLKRGAPALQRTLIANPQAQLSESGYARVIMDLKDDKDFAAAIAARADVPDELRPWLTAILED